MQPQESEAGDTPDAPTEADADIAVAGTLPSAAVRVAAPIVVLSDDAVLLDAMSRAALDRALLIVCPSTDRFVDQLLATPVELALIDTSVVTEPATLLDSLRRQFPHLQLLVAGPGSVQHQIGQQLNDGTVFRFAHKPTSAARLKLFIDAALRERQTRITADILRAPVAPGADLIANAVRTAVRRHPLFAAALLLTAGASGMYWYTSHQTPRSVFPIVTPIMRATAQAPQIPLADTGPSAEAIEQTMAGQTALGPPPTPQPQRSEQQRLAAEFAAEMAAANAAHQAARAAQSQPRRAMDQVVTPMPSQTASLTGRLPVPDMDLTLAPVLATSALMDESRLRRVSFVSPSYPVEALRNGITGDVEMDFTVTATGEVTDVAVTSALPVGLFEQTSIEALSHSRYEPVQRDGVAVSQRAHLRMRYEL